MEASIQNNHTTNSTMTSRLGNSCDRIERKLDQHDILLQDQNRAHAATNNVIRSHSRVHSNNHNILRSAIDGLDVKLNNIETKQKYQEILLQNQKWVYSAPSPTEEEWESYADDDADDDIDDAKEFLQQIKKMTEDIRWSQTNGNITLCPSSNFAYNRMFLPHWEEFANALNQYQYYIKCVDKTTDSNKPSLELIGMELPNEVIDRLSKALKSTRFYAFSIEDNPNFGQKDINFALEYLKTNVDMQVFSISNNIIPTEDIERLSEIVKNHPSLRCLPRTTENENFEMIMNAGKNKLEAINLSFNRISTEGGTCISNCLTQNPVLVSLYLEGNELDDRAAILIAESLKHNISLRFLHLTENNITQTGWKALRKAEFDDTSLNTAFNSNHTCNINYPLDRDVREGLDVSEMNGDILCTEAFDSRSVRRKKIYSILSTRNRDCSNVGNFDDDMPVELLPHMLHSIHRFSNYRDGGADISQVRGHVHPLSLVYEICRHWEKSLATFEELSS